MPDVTTRDIATRDITTRDIATRDINASTASTILYQWNGTGTTATVGDDPTFPTVGDSGNNNRMEFDGSNWSYVNEDEPRFFSDKGYMAEGAATEICGYSADLTNAAWAKTSANVAKDAVGLTGASNEAFTVTDTSSGVDGRTARGIPITSGTSTYYMVLRTKYVASPTTYPEFLMYLSGGTLIVQSIVFNPSDGSYVVRSAAGYDDGAVVSVSRHGDWWVVIQSLTDNASGNTGCTMELRPSVNTDASQTRSGAPTASCVIASAELYKDNYSFSPILTTGGTTKTRLADTGATLPFDWSECDAEGGIEFTVTPFFAPSPGTYGIITPQSLDFSCLMYFSQHASANRIILTDDVTFESYDGSWSSSGESVDIKARWGSGTMRASYGGVADSSAVFGGTFSPSGLVTLFNSLALAASIKDIVVYSEDKGDDWLTE